MFTLMTLAAIGCWILFLHPAALCFLVPLWLPALVRMLHIRELRIAGGEEPTLTDDALTLGSSWIVSLCLMLAGLAAFLLVMIPLSATSPGDMMPLNLLQAMGAMLLCGGLAVRWLWNFAWFPRGKPFPRWRERAMQFGEAIGRIVLVLGPPVAVMIVGYRFWPPRLQYNAAPYTPWLDQYLATWLGLVVPAYLGYLWGKTFPQWWLATIIIATLLAGSGLFQWHDFWLP
jgi:hypothetical protein